MILLFPVGKWLPPFNLAGLNEDLKYAIIHIKACFLEKYYSISINIRGKIPPDGLFCFLHFGGILSPP